MSHASSAYVSPARRLRATLAGAALATVLLPSIALAHGKLVRSTPSAGSRVGNAPTELRLTFSEKAELAMTRVRLLDAKGKALTLAPLAAGGDAGKTVVAAVRGPLAPGAYTVSWQMAGRDGHPVRGRFNFVVSGANGAPAAGAARGERR